MRLWVVNVGANTGDAAAHGLRSPVCPDGTFEFVPIVERMQNASGAPTYGELPAWTRDGTTLAPFVPARMHTVRAHDDPDFARLTYGDAQNPRGISLRHIEPDDELWFLARLWEHDGARFTGGSAFFFAGVFEIEANLPFEQGEGECPPHLRERLEANAHRHRTRAGDPGSYRVLFGQPERSGRFDRPIRVTPEIAGRLFAAEYDAPGDRYVDGGEVVRNKNGNPRTWRHFCSITRTIQWFLDSKDPRHERHLAALRALAAGAGWRSPPLRHRAPRRSMP